MNFVGRRTVHNCQRFAMPQKAMHIFAAIARHAFAFPLLHERQAALTWVLFRRSNGSSDGFSLCGSDALVRKGTPRRSGKDGLGAISLDPARRFVIALRFHSDGKESNAA
jgi:hypothetical protein